MNVKQFVERQRLYVAEKAELMTLGFINELFGSLYTLMSCEDIILSSRWIIVHADTENESVKISTAIREYEITGTPVIHKLYGKTTEHSPNIRRLYEKQVFETLHDMLIDEGFMPLNEVNVIEDGKTVPAKNRYVLEV